MSDDPRRRFEELADEVGADIIPVATGKDGTALLGGGRIVTDAEGTTIDSTEWVPVRCVKCGCTASAPIEAAIKFQPGPDGVYVGACGQCAVGARLSPSDPDPPRNRAERRRRP